MQRTSIKTLELLVTWLNEVTKSPVKAVSSQDKNFVWNIGCYTLSQSYGGTGLERIANENGGVNTIFHTTTKKELEAQIRAFIKGLTYEQQR